MAIGRRGDRGGMRGEQWREVTQRVYPAAIASRRLWWIGLLIIGAGLPLALWGLQRFQIRPTETAIEATILPDTPRPDRDSRPTPLPMPSATRPAPAPLEETAPPVAMPTPIASAGVTATLNAGSLRVSNRTEHPIRVALLSQHSQAEPADMESVPTAVPTATPTYDEPVHWDFAPQEGSTSGLILSLPEQALQLQPGDVLVAFAQDGSRRYWGPYVVGKTPTPIWQSSDAEWQLILTP